MAISDEAIRAAVESAEYSDPAATSYLADVIIARRDKVGLTWLNVVNPLVDFQLSPSGAFSSRNIAVDTRRALPAESYQARWGALRQRHGQGDPGRRAADGDAAASSRRRQPFSTAPSCSWRSPRCRRSIRRGPTPVRVRFRRAADGWQLVGVVRTPEPAASDSSR